MGSVGISVTFGIGIGIRICISWIFGYDCLVLCYRLTLLYIDYYCFILLYVRYSSDMGCRVFKSRVWEVVSSPGLT